MSREGAELLSGLCLAPARVAEGQRLAVVRATAEEACLVLPGDGVLGPCAELRHTCDPLILPSLANLQA